MGTSNAGVPAAGSNNVRKVERYVAGAEGAFDIIGASWSWDAYYQYGAATLNEALINTWNFSRMALATDAVAAPAGNSAGIAEGTIVCRSTLSNPADGCAPINRIGIGGVTQEALDYIFGDQPYRQQILKQNVAALNFSTTRLFDNWAGPVSFAMGAEYRTESIDGFVDPQHNSGWLYGNYLVTEGDYNVAEGYVETAFPILDGVEFNGAFRATGYSTSGFVTTWKTGLVWQVTDDVRLRGTYSRDIRAPNLAELFAPGTARTNTVNVPVSGGTLSDQFTEQTTGNIDLTPEEASTLGVGVVVTPGFLPGFSASVDYYDIDLKDAIGTITAQTTINLCYEQGRADICENITYADATQTDITGIKLVPFNFSSQRSKGLDIEASYRREIGPGDLSLRGFATYYLKQLVDNGIDFPVEYAGTNSSFLSTPDFVYRVSAGYDIDSWNLSLVGRGLTGGVYDNSFIECASNCPASTPEHRTINDNHIDGAFYLDLSATKSFQIGGASAEAFIYVRNLMDKDPVLVGNGPFGNNTPAYAQTNRALYDVLGRVFRVGVRIQL
jgi:outer membrane receptor protein involved in Fe transport